MEEKLSPDVLALVAEGHRGRALEGLEAALMDHQNRSPSRAISSLYYFAFHLASSILADHGVQAKTHAGVQSIMNAQFGRGAEDRRAGLKAFGVLGYDRNRSDYSVLEEITVEDVEQAREQAIKVLNTFADLLPVPFLSRARDLLGLDGTDPGPH